MRSRVQRTVLASAAIAALAGCQPAPSKLADPSGQADSQMSQVLVALNGMGGKPIETLSADEARRQPTAAMAAMAVQRQTTGAAAPLPVAEVRDITVQGAAGPLQARVYNPMPGSGPLPVVLYFQGGGWVIADLDTYDAGARALAAEAHAVVVSVQYRKGPENRFPAAHDDAVSSYRWLLAHARDIGGDASRVAVAGESAGGNLALTTAIAARDGGLPAPRAIISVYPVAGTDPSTSSEKAYVQAKPLSTPMLPWFLKNYTNGSSDLKDPRLDLVGAANLAGLPPVTLILAEIDPLRSGGEALASKLKAAGNEVTVAEYPGVTHEFFGMGSVVGKAKDAEDFAGARLRSAFAMPGTPGMVLDRRAGL